MFQVQQEKFNGPLGLLLELIEKEKLSISEISLAKVTDDYIAYVKGLRQIDPEELAEFLVVAAQLMLLKSRALLPSLKISDEEEASLDELEARLAQYKRIRDAVNDLRVLEARGAHIASREPYAASAPVFYPPPGVGAELLRAAFEAFLAALPKFEKLAEEKIHHIISLEEKISAIRVMLQETVERAFSELIRGAKEKVDVIMNFLAILELSKQKFVDLRQARPFEDIMIRRIGVRD